MTEDPDWSPIPFSNVFTGHIITGAIVGTGVLITSDILAFFFVGKPSYRLIFFTVAISFVLKEFVSTHFSQYRSAKFRHPIPGGLAVPIANLVFALVFYLLVGWFFFQFSITLTLILVSALTLEAFIQVATKSWERGMTRAEMRAAWEATKKMTVELMQED